MQSSVIMRQLPGTSILQSGPEIHKKQLQEQSAKSQVTQQAQQTQTGFQNAKRLQLAHVPPMQEAWQSGQQRGPEQQPQQPIMPAQQPGPAQSQRQFGVRQRGDEAQTITGASFAYRSARVLTFWRYSSHCKLPACSAPSGRPLQEHTNAVAVTAFALDRYSVLHVLARRHTCSHSS